MFALTQSHRFYILNRPTDMRKSFNALSGLIHTVLHRNPLSGEVFIFTNRQKNLMKLLHWQDGGFVLYYKRLEKGTFEIDFNKQGTTEQEISYPELTMLVAGISVRNIRKLKRFSK